MTVSSDSYRVAVDICPILPGGVNGGAKPLILELLNSLGRRGWRLCCLCGLEVFDELRSKLDDSIELHIVAPWETMEGRYHQLAEANAFALNFFPFTDVSIVAPGVRNVSVVHDIQFADLPNNFSSADRAGRHANFMRCVGLSDRIIAVSHFSKSRVAIWSEFPEADIDVIHNSRATPSFLDDDKLEALYADLELKRNGYIIYPANFWEHKNHRLLISAFCLFRKQSQSGLKLVLSGDPGSPLGREIQLLADNLCSGAIVLPGYVAPEAIQSLIKGARAVIFPSEYEGFGMPVLEAMNVDVPVAAAWTSSIPEVADGAALLFDFRRPRDLAKILLEITGDADIRAELVRRGRERVANFTSHEEMVRLYEQSFQAAINQKVVIRNQISGVHPDGWMGRLVNFSVAPRSGNWTLKMSMEVPPFFPKPYVTLNVLSDLGNSHFAMRKGKRYQFQMVIPASGTKVRFLFSAFFKPCDVLETIDERELCVSLMKALIVGENTTIDFIRPEKIDDNADGEVNFVVSLSRAAASDQMEVVATSILTEDAREDDLSLDVVVTGGSGETVECRRLPGSFDAKSATLSTSVEITSASKAEIRISPPRQDVSLLSYRSRPIGSPTFFNLCKSTSILNFSVVTPSYNQGRFIKRTIESVLRQELVRDYNVCDGGSNDETVEILSSYRGHLSFQSRKDKGQADAVNQGIALGSGQIIAWINSDDTYEAGAFSRVAEVFASSPEVEVVYGEGYHIDETDHVIERYPTEDFRLSRLFETCFICQPAVFFRRSVVERLGGLRESLQYCMDYELWLRFGVAGIRFHRLNAFLANTRFYLDTKTLGARPMVHREINDMFLSCFGVATDKWIDAFAYVVSDELHTKSGVNKAKGFAKARHLAKEFWQAQAG